MRVGTKLLLLAMLPVCCVAALAVVSAVSDYRTAHRLSRYRADARLSFALAPLGDDLAHERRAAVLVRADPGPAQDAQLAAYERATTLAFEQARSRAVHVAAPVDVVGALDAARRQRQALVLQLDAGSLGPEQAIAGYSLITQKVLGLAAALNGGAPSPASAQAAAAYGSINQAIESASRDRVFVVTLLAPHGPRPQPTASPWEDVESAELNAFRQSAAGPQAADLESVLFSPAGTAVQNFRDRLSADPAAAVRGTPLQQWLSVSETRITALRGVAAAAGRNLLAVVSDEFDNARARAVRDLALSLAVLVLVTALALALRRSITGPVREVSAAARGLAHGDIAARVDYSSQDEIGDVAAAFRDVHATAARLVDEIRAKNQAVRENRLEHRGDLAGLEGVWSQLVAGMNDTMAAFAELQGRRQHAERETARIFEMSLDLLCVLGFDGYFKRVNPAFERTLGYSRDALLSRPGFDFAHPDDLERSREIFSALRHGEQLEQFENRNICADGSIRWLEWSARAVPEEGLIYAVARDITATRRAAEEQAALRHVATLVARAVAPEEVFAAVAEEAGRLLSADAAMIGRYGAGPTVTGVVAWRKDGKPNPIPLGTGVPLGGQNVMSQVFSTGGPARIEAYSKASGELAEHARAHGNRSSIGVPIEVGGQPWGVMTVSMQQEGPWPPGTEEQLARFSDLAATAIANAEAREGLRHFADEQTALRRVATLVARGAPPEVVFAAVAEEVARVLPGVDMTRIGRYTPDRSVEFVGGWSSVGHADGVGTTTVIGGQNVSSAVFETGQPARVDELEDDGTPVTGLALRAGARSTAGAPIKIEGQLWGVMIVASVQADRLPAGIEHELAGFTELLATAIANTQAREELAASRARLVTAADETRRRIVRDLHDGAQNRLVQTIITLNLAARAQDRGESERANQLFGEALGHAERANAELRELVQGILPSVLARGGLAASVEELVERLRLPVGIDVTRDRFHPEIEANAYFVVAEALTNLAKHSQARSATVAACVEDGHLQLDVSDDGVGGAQPEGGGLRGLADRVAALGGQVRIDSPPGGGTRISATLPLEE
ncbi:MAG: GAF domain-containing protein [Solirubrobacterales bacterium]|nr:GAF domain-containing protein [Solirubrobacterales bacterium]